MVFKRGVSQNLITLTERKTRFTIAIKNKNRRSEPTALAIIRRLMPIKGYIDSITFDQGTEFSRFDWVKECLDTKIFFCEAASPHQKGSIENRNGVIRTVYSREYDIIQASQKKIDAVIDEINDRPKKCLNFNSPLQLFREHTMLGEMK